MLDNRFLPDVLGNVKLYTINDAHKQCSLLGTLFNYIPLGDLQGNIYNKIKKTYYVSAGGFWGIKYRWIPGAQNKRYS